MILMNSYVSCVFNLGLCVCFVLVTILSIYLFAIIADKMDVRTITFKEKLMACVNVVFMFAAILSGFFAVYHLLSGLIWAFRGLVEAIFYSW